MTAWLPGLRIAQCPCQLGKPVVSPQHVLNTRVHKSVARPGQRLLGLDVRCGYVVHMQALISSKRPWNEPQDIAPRNDTLLLGTWRPSHGGAGWLELEPEQPPMLSAGECTRSRQQLLQRCNLQG